MADDVAGVTSPDGGEAAGGSAPVAGDLEALRERVGRLPRTPGVYLWKDPSGEVLYVGKANDLRARVRNYLALDQGAKNAAMVEHAADVDYIAVRNQKEALMLEQTLIKRHKPRYNVRLTDGKQYPYLKLTAGPWPRLVKTHRFVDDGGTYFGPFPDGYGAFHVRTVLNDLVPLRRCRTLPKQKCLYYDLGKCVAPCIDACTQQEYAELIAEVKALLGGRADHILRRLKSELEQAAAEHRFEDAARIRDQLQGLEGVLERQHVFSNTLEDRDVAGIACRGDHAVVSILHQRGGRIVGQSPFSLSGAAGEPDAEVLADFLRGHYANQPAIPRHVAIPFAQQAPGLEEDLRLLAGHAVTVEAPQRGDKLRWIEVARTNAELRLEEDILKQSRRGMGAVEALQNVLGLADAPRVIEGFDISHHAGGHTRAAMVRFVDGESDKAGYRIFGMKSVGDNAVAAGTAVARGSGREVDDFRSMEEAVGRRLRGLLERDEPLPDLIVIDGGRGQLDAARRAATAAGAPDVPLVSIAKKEEELYLPKRLLPVKLPRSDPGLQLVQRVRDEAHRFGITQVRRKATASAAAGPLERVKGIGPKRRAELVKLFGGLEGLRQASVDDLIRVPGVTRPVAERIVAALEA